LNQHEEGARENVEELVGVLAPRPQDHYQVQQGAIDGKNVYGIKQE
jgi:hypothetical protein